MTDDKNRVTRSTPPEDDDDWSHVWLGIDKAHKSWLITGPIVALVSNWKAIAAVVGVVVWLNRLEISAAIAVLFGAGV